MSEKLYVGVDGKTISAGIIICNGKEILGGHCTGKKWAPGNWDIIKGGIDDGEEPLEAALRECREEIGLDFSDENLIDLGLFPYATKKNLYLFYCEPKQEINPKNIKCQSFFVAKNGKEYPELDYFEWIPIDTLDKFYRQLQNTLPLAFKKLKSLQGE